MTELDEDAAETPFVVDATTMRERIRRGKSTPELFRSGLSAVPPAERDAWLDAVLGTSEVVDDGPLLPRGGVPYLPCPVDALLRAVALAGVTAQDRFVDIGAGVGRTALAVHLLTGARVLGLEVQPHLVAAATALATELGVEHASFSVGDAADEAQPLPMGTVYFLYCPFGGERLVRFLGALEAMPSTAPIRLCTVDLPLPEARWLEPVAGDRDIAVFRRRS